MMISKRDLWIAVSRTKGWYLAWNYVVGGELEGKWSSDGYAFDLQDSLKQKPIANNKKSLFKMSSLAPVITNQISGFFIAGLLANEMDGFSAIQFYSSDFNRYSSIADKNDNPFSYDPQGGFPALKHFLFKQRHYLLIAGGIDSKANASRKLQVISLKEKIILNGKTSEVTFIEFKQHEVESSLPQEDYFPHN